MDQSVRVTSEALQAELLRRKYIELLDNPDVFPSMKNWEYIIKNAMGGDIGPLLYHKYLVALLTPTVDRVDSHLAAIREFPRYLSAIGYDDAVNTIYSDMHTIPEESLKLAKRFNLFSSRGILRLVEDGDLSIAVELMSVLKPDYVQSDLPEMKLLLHNMRTLPHIGSIEMSKSMFGGGLRYICPAGHVNNAEDLFCRCDGCGMNICGLTRSECDGIDAFENVIDVLSDMFAEQQ